MPLLDAAAASCLLPPCLDDDADDIFATLPCRHADAAVADAEMPCHYAIAVADTAAALPRSFHAADTAATPPATPQRVDATLLMPATRLLMPDAAMPPRDAASRRAKKCRVSGERHEKSARREKAASMRCAYACKEEG